MSEDAMPNELERLLRDDDGALYADEAAARAIAIVINLFQKEHYSWPQWIDMFSAEIDAPGHYRHSPDGAAKAEEVLSGDGKNINRNYAGLWLAACEKLLIEKGLLTRSELAAKLAALRQEDPPDSSFAVGERVTVRDIEPSGPDHLPLFVRLKTGIVERRLGNNPDRPVYNIRFTARDLWGSDAPAKDSVNFTIGQDYLMPG
jgi:nitrile hydratase